MFYEMFTVYVIYSDSVKKKYTGYTHDFELRLHQHNNGLLNKSIFKKTVIFADEKSFRLVKNKIIIKHYLRTFYF